MIFYFSGTGNAQWVAEELGRLLSEPLTAMNTTTIATTNYKQREGERLLFVQPVHSWGPALMTLRFIEKAKIEARDAWAVMVCGDNCGNSDHMLRKALGKRGIELLGTFSVQMPNNYVLMKGFGCDPDSLAQQKLDAAPARVKQVSNAILAGNGSAPDLYVRGTKPALKSGLVYPLFRRFAVRRVLFEASDACTSCGLCSRICPTQNIRLVDGRPQWGSDCVQCVACIHRCPAQAIEYGTVSQGQGRYHHPNVH